MPMQFSDARDAARRKISSIIVAAMPRLRVVRAGSMRRSVHCCLKCLHATTLGKRRRAEPPTRRERRRPLAPLLLLPIALLLLIRLPPDGCDTISPLIALFLFILRRLSFRHAVFRCHTPAFDVFFFYRRSYAYHRAARAAFHRAEE